MRHILSKLLLSALLTITTLTYILSQNSYAREQKEETVAKTPIDKIDKADLLKTLKKGESVKGRTIQGSDIIEIIKETDLTIKIKDSVIKNGLDFTDLEPINGKREIDNEIEIVGSEIESGIVELSPGKQVEGSIITIDPETEFAHENKPPVETYFKKNISFQNTEFSSTAGFDFATFSGSADFSSATFSSDANFSFATLSGDASFISVKFEKLAYFREAQFLSGFKLGNVLFKGYTDFRNARIKGLNYDNSSSVDVVGRLDFRGAWITEAHFKDVIFGRDVDFSDVEFGKFIEDRKPNEAGKPFPEADKPNASQERIISGSPSKPSPEADNPATVFRFVTFESDVYFIKTKFHGDIAFEDVNFKGEANFTNAEFGEANFTIAEFVESTQNDEEPKFSFSYLNFKNLILSFDQLPKSEYWSKYRIKSFVDKAKQREREEDLESEKELQPISQVLAVFEAAFRNEDKLKDGNQAYYHMKKAELNEISEDTTWYQELKTWERWEWILWGWSSGYGTKFWRIVFWYMSFFLIFALLYYIYIEDIKQERTDDNKADSQFALRLITFPWYFTKSEGIKNKELIDFATALKLSKVLLFKVGRKNIIGSSKIVEGIVWVEWVLGYYLLVVFAITLVNTSPIINKLVGAVF